MWQGGEAHLIKVHLIKILIHVKLALEWNCSFQFLSYKQCYQKVYQGISICEIKTSLPLLITISPLSDISTPLKIGITITWNFALCYVTATTSLWCWKKIPYNDVYSILIRNRSTARQKANVAAKSRGHGENRKNPHTLRWLLIKQRIKKNPSNTGWLLI